MINKPIILCYHEIEETVTPAPYTISPTTFSEHLRYLSQNNFQTLSFEDYSRNYSNIAGTTYATPVIITFDDGHRSQYQKAYHLLAEKNLKATFFITTDYINQDLYVSPSNLREMHKNGMEIGGHAQSHAFLDELDKEKLSDELGNSKRKLEEILDEPIGFFSCPGGRYNRQVIECASKLGYRGMCTSYPGSHTVSHGLHIFSRVLIRRNTSLQEFSNIVNIKSSLLLKLRCKDKLKTLAKKALGNRLYYQLWSRYAKKQ